jgi:hypothetical protein
MGSIVVIVVVDVRLVIADCVKLAEILTCFGAPEPVNAPAGVVIALRVKDVDGKTTLY